MRAATLSTTNPLLPRTPARTSCAVVATRIKWKATPAVAPGQRRGKAKTAKEKDSEQARLQTSDLTQRALWTMTIQTRHLLGNIKAFDASSNRLKRFTSLKSSSTLERVNFCQPLQGVNCSDMVRATKRRTTSPTTMPLTPPSGFDDAVNLPIRMMLMTASGK